MLMLLGGLSSGGVHFGVMDMDYDGMSLIVGD